MRGDQEEEKTSASSKLYTGDEGNPDITVSGLDTVSE